MKILLTHNQVQKHLFLRSKILDDFDSNLIDPYDCTVYLENTLQQTIDDIAQYTIGHWTGKDYSRNKYKQFIPVVYGLCLLKKYIKPGKQGQGQGHGHGQGQGRKQ